MEEEGFSIQFIDVTKELDRINDCMVCRDYYTPAIYYRLLIPEMFPQYDKVLYMDCDTVVLTDIAELYDIEIGDNYIGAVADQAVASVPQFCAYTENALGIPPTEYFNSGVIVMHLLKFREINFCREFERVLRSYRFIVAPDQDILNLICKGKVYYYDECWNQMPIAGNHMQTPKLIHYNLCMKPWHYDGVLYEEYFWTFASKTEFLEVIRQAKASFTPERAKKDEEGGARLLALAQSEADSPNNYIRSARSILKKIVA
jgi:lipopolysaccharide biosynthesis glycosyltransferase